MSQTGDAESVQANELVPATLLMGDSQESRGSTEKASGGDPNADDGGGVSLQTPDSQIDRPRTISRLLEYAFDRGSKSLALSSDDVKALCVTPGMEEEELRVLRNGSKSDYLFDMPPRLLVFAAQPNVDELVRRRLLRLASYAMALHPVFAQEQAFLTEGAASDDRIDCSRIAERARTLPAESLNLPETGKMSAPQRARLVANCVTAVGLLQVLRDRWSLSELVEAWSQTLWTRSARGRYSASAALAFPKDPDALGILAHLGAEVLKDLERRVAELTAFMDHQLAQNRILEERVSDAGVLLADAQSAALRNEGVIRDLQNRLSSESAERIADQSHHLDDFETLRTRVLQKLVTQTEMLSDGLHALRNGRVTVAEEFVDRAVRALTQEIDLLKEDSGA